MRIKCHPTRCSYLPSRQSHSSQLPPQLRLQHEAQAPENQEILRVLSDPEEPLLSPRVQREACKASPVMTKHGSYDDNPSPAGQLSQSPLTDPFLKAARLQYREMKPIRRKDGQSQFQKQLRRNPFAQALATPIRHCLLTGARLPNYFLLNFGLATHPETGTKWHLPRIAVEVSAESVNETSKASSGVPDQDPPAQEAQPCTSQKAGSNLPSRRLSGTHFLATHQALSHVSSLGSAQYKNLTPYRWKEDSTINPRDIVWREDMSDYVRELLRKGVVHGLGYLASRPAAYVLGCDDWLDVQKYAQIGAVLWLGVGAMDDCNDEGSGNSRVKSKPSASKQWQGKAPPAYAMYLHRGRHIPIYNLQALLGTEYVASLMVSRPRQYGTHLAVLKNKNPTLKVQLELWKLLGYCGQDRQ